MESRLSRPLDEPLILLFAGGLRPFSDTPLVDPLFTSEFEFDVAILKGVTNPFPTV
jgi:hypothetical protein